MIPVLRYLFVHDARTESLKLKDLILKQLKEADMGVDYDFYAASGPDDALRHVSLYCDLNRGLDTCFVSCGGDDLTAAVAAGLMGAGEGKSLAVFDPDGTNSLAKCFEGKDFGSIAGMLAGSFTDIDMIRINNAYAVCACTFGLEDLSGGAPGLMKSVAAVLRRSFRSVRITADSIPLDTGTVLIFTVANGKYAIGGIPCAPQALIDDGKADLCIVRNMSPTRLMKVLSLLVEGTLLDDPSLTAELILRKVRTLKVESHKDLTVMADGRPLTGKEFTVRLLPAAVRMVVPAAR